MQIQELSLKQNKDGSFGRFHSMSVRDSLTTEKALRRFMYLGLNKNNPTVKKCLEYLKNCLNKKVVIPDRREKVINWDVFEELMFSAWLCVFDEKERKVLEIQSTWKSVITKSVIDGIFKFEEYKKQYRLVFGNKGTREIGPTSFYMVMLLKNILDSETSDAYFEYIMENGIYYIYNENLYKLPDTFDSKKTINYLNAIKMVSSYPLNIQKLWFVKKWLIESQALDGYWYMDSIKPDGLLFPTSINWRKYENRLHDINSFLNGILNSL